MTSTHKTRQGTEHLRTRVLQLVEALQDIAAELSLDRLLQRIVDNARMVVQARYAALGILDQDHRIHQFITSGVSPEEREGIGHLPQGKGLLGLVLRSAGPVRVDDIAAHPASVGFPPGHPPMRTFLGTPVRYGGRVLGNLYLTDKEGSQTFTAFDEQLLTMFAAQAGIALEHARIFHQLEQRNREMEAVFSVGRSLAETLDVNRVASHALSAILNVTGADGAEIWLVDASGELALLEHQGLYASAFLDKPRLSPGEGIPGLAAQTGTPQVVADLQNDPRFVLEPARRLGFHTFLALPLTAQGKVIGVLGVASLEPGHLASPEELRLLEFIGGRVAVAIQRARLYEAAAQERAYLEAILDSMAEGVHTTDVERVIRRINQTGASIKGLTPQQAIGRRCRDVFAYRLPSGEVLCDVACPVLEVLQTGKPAHVMEVQVTTPEGRGVPVALTAAPLRDGQGKIVGAVEVSRDISHRKGVDELRSNIVSMVSHELRTPLLHIKGFSSSLLQPDVQWDEETRTDFIRTIDREADRLTRLVSDLLDMSRLESGRVTMDPQATEVEPLLLAGIRRASPFTREHTVVTRHAHHLPLVWADTSQVERVMENLLENAAKYSPPGSRIIVSARLHTDNMVISVEDRGIGVPPHERERIFEKFVRLRHNQVQLPPGTGLGLSICKAIVEAHHGRIWVEKNGKKGSIFSFALPVVRSRRAARRRAPSGVSA